MSINLKFNSALTVALLSGFCSIAAASAEESDCLAPEATAAEAELSFRDIPLLENAFLDPAPVDRNDGLVVGELSVNSGNKDIIVKLAKEIADSQHGTYDSLLIAHKGKLLFESYYRRGRINLAHSQASATKTYTGLALGRAIQLGYLTMADLDKPLVSFFDELDPEKFTEGAELITLHNALTMTTGIRIPQEKWAEFEETPGEIQGDKHLQAILEHTEPITAESQTYVYGTGPGLVMQVIEAVVPGSAEDFIKNELLDKLAITNYNWSTHANGLPEAGWRVSMTSRDMMKWGTLILNNGKLDGEQLISAQYLSRATSGLTQTTAEWQPDTYRYGHLMYQTNLIVGDQTYDATFSWGGGGQYIIIVQELDLLITITGHDGLDKIMEQVAENILPVFIQ